MKRLVEFPLGWGGSVLIGLDEPPAGPPMRGLGKGRFALVEQADRTFEEATGANTPLARSLTARLRSIEDLPDMVGIELGVQLSAHAETFIASVATEANPRVSRTWRLGGAAGR